MWKETKAAQRLRRQQQMLNHFSGTWGRKVTPLREYSIDAQVCRKIKSRHRPGYVPAYPGYLDVLPT